MHKAFALMILLFLILVSGCTASTGNVAETTKLGMPETPEQSPAQETIEELHKEFEEFEKSQAGNLSEENEVISPTEQNESQEGAIIEETEETQNITEEEAIPEEEAATQNESTQKQCPSCEDNNSCTGDSCSEETDYECIHEPVIPCCGNGECEEKENWTTCSKDCECSVQCEPCENLNDESCTCLPKTECVSDGCCPEGCDYPDDSDCPKPSAVFSEIHYDIYLNGSDSDVNHEWIEVYNNGTVAIDLAKWVFFEGETNHRIENISDITMLNPDSYAIIAENSAQFILDYPHFTAILFDSSFYLNNTGEPLALKPGRSGDIADYVFYSSSWGGNGNGFSLEKIDLAGPNTQENWNSSAVEGGTPGLKNSVS